MLIQSQSVQSSQGQGSVVAQQRYSLRKSFTETFAAVQKLFLIQGLG